MQRNKMAVVLLVLLIAACLVFSSIILSQDHICTDEDCLICICVGMCRKTLEVLLIFGFVSGIFRVMYRCRRFIQSTGVQAAAYDLISMKVKLSI